MDSEIKRLLKLANIPGFQLSDKEIRKLEDWKAKQKSVKPVKAKAKKAPKGFKYDKEMGTASGPTMIEVKEVKDELETDGMVEISRPEFVNNVVEKSENELDKNIGDFKE